MFVLEDPGVRVRHEHSVEAGGERGVDVGFWAVADHPGALGIEPAHLRQFFIRELV